MLEIGVWYEYIGTPSAATTTNAGGIDLMIVSQDTVNNTSLIRIRPWIKKISGTGNYNLNSKTMTVKVGTETLTTVTKYDLRNQTNGEKLYLADSYPFLKYSGNGYLLDGQYVYDFTVNHNSNGTATDISVYAFIPMLNTASGKNHIVDITICQSDILKEPTNRLFMHLYICPFNNNKLLA